jgi:hypothetical protein
VRLFISSELIYRSKLRLNDDDGQNLQKARVRAELVKQLLILNLIIKLIYKKITKYLLTQKDTTCIYKT